MGLAWEPTADFLEHSNLARFMGRHSIGSFEELRGRWIDDIEWFWSAAAEDLGIRWLSEPTQTLDRTRGVPWAQWFPDGVTNLVLSCVEKHDRDRLAYVWEGEEGAVRRMTYGELSDLVSRIAGGLRKLGVGKGDRVGIYMPLAPETFACMYGLAKIGAIAIPNFSGFGADPIVTRLIDAQAKVLITADGFYRRGRTIETAAIAREVHARVPSLEHVVIWPRLGDGNWEEFLDAEPVLDCEPVAATYPFLVAYTSGTTGTPKGAVHGHAGFPLKVAADIAYQTDHRDGELLFWMGDPGWITGPMTMVGAGLTGRPLFLHDGAPDFPTPARISEMIRRHDIAIFATAPTFVRALMRQAEHGFEDAPPSLRVLGSSGEAWNPDPWWWYFERVGGGRCPIINSAGGTEAGALVGTVGLLGIKPGSFNTTAVGVDADVFGRDGKPVPPGEVGELVVKQPWPGRTLGVWQNDERYLEAYWQRWTDVYVHGDWAMRDEEGFWWLHGRSDDSLMIAGKRVGPAEVESLLVSHPRVNEAAVVGVADELRGDAMWCLVVPTSDLDVEGLGLELVDYVASALGKSFKPQRVEVVASLPKTRSGKIMRRVIRATISGDDPGDLTSLDNPESLDEIRSFTRVAS